MNWINIKDKLPPEKKYVLAKHNTGTWIDRDDQQNVNCVVVKLVKGISLKERKQMELGEIPSFKVGNYERWEIYYSQDEFGNNNVPYHWDTFGHGSFFGQEIICWKPIEDNFDIKELKNYLNHLQTCNLNQDWTEALNAIAQIPDKFRDQSWKEHRDKLDIEMNTCTCGLAELLEKIS